MHHQKTFFLLAVKDSLTIQQHISMLLSYTKLHCYHCGLDKETAKDITARSIEKLLEDIDSGRFIYLGVAPIAWAKAIARNLILEGIKRKKKWDYLPIEDYFEKITEDDTEKQVDNKNMINIMLGYLKPNERLLITLYYLLGYTDKQIIEHKLTHYKSNSVVKVLRVKALNKLKEKFPNPETFYRFDNDGMGYLGADLYSE